MDEALDMISEGSPDPVVCDACTRAAVVFYNLACCGYPVNSCQHCHDLTQDWINEYGETLNWDCKHCGAENIPSKEFFILPVR